jgi:cell division protein FtsL
MQAPLKRDSVEYKALYSKSDSKVATPKKVKKISPIKKVFMIFQIVIYSIVFILLLAITLSKP